MTQPHRFAWSLLPLLLFPFLTPTLAHAATPTRTVHSLNGPWEFQRDGAPANAWKPVTLPASFESHEGTEFNGVGWYRRAITPPPIPAQHRLLLHFQAAATDAQVWGNDQPLGTHSGGWTPFRFDLTDLARQLPPGHPLQLKVRLDEKVGHNTQGFLPIIAPHFGGLWQDIQLLVVPETYLDDLHVLASGDPRTGRLTVEVPLLGASVAPAQPPGLRYRLRGTRKWQSSPAHATHLPPDSIHPVPRWRLTVPVPQPKLWWPEQPHLYEIELTSATPPHDRIVTRTGFRRVEARGTALFLNDRPLAVRGLLNWGYSPPQTDPNPGETWWRHELDFARARGFNLMKFCLWIPPRRYLELADEQGMLTWMEYPTWHPTMTRQFLEPLRREFAEFHAYDRNHPSILFRSLTCETGSGAELEVIQALYDQAHAMIPGALVEDDSSWIQWNRVHDFYDDHPYGNNHTWVDTLAGLNQYIAERTPKPLLLGEAIAADSWVLSQPLLERCGTNRPFWFPLQVDDQPRWLAEATRAAQEPIQPAQLHADSLRYGLLMRKFQIESFRREVPHGGYVVSVIRDIPNAAMGLLDHLGQPKWSRDDWAWHGDTMILLAPTNDHRAFLSGQTLQPNLLLSHFGPHPLRQPKLTVTLEHPARAHPPLARSRLTLPSQNPGTLTPTPPLTLNLPTVTSPTQVILRASLRDRHATAENHWPLWIVPTPPPPLPHPPQLHPSVPPDLAAELFPDSSPSPNAPTPNTLLVATRFDDTLIQALENGARVLFLPDGEKHSFPLTAHWFLRGAPWIPPHPLVQSLPPQSLLDLQHFDLASRVIPNLHYLASLSPILMLWDTHDLSTVKTHGLIFESKVGPGRLLVSAVNHRGPHNHAGRWLLRLLLDHLDHGPALAQSFQPEHWQQLKDKLHEDKLDLTERPWQFRPDPKAEGVAQAWADPARSPDSEWQPIRVGRAWEGQGYPNLDRWAWYRLAVPIPAPWQNRPTYLSFEGVDDCYELFVNGQLVGRGGDPERKIDTFSERRSWDITRWIQPGQPAVIAVRVYDWYGAGGIFRPVTLATRPLLPTPDLIR